MIVEVLLDLALDDTEPAEVRPCRCELEELVLVADGDIPALLRVRVDGRALALPQVPLGA